MKMLDLCSGIAGISMAADWAGIGTAYRLSVSARHIKDTGHLLLATPTTSQNYKPIRELCPSEANGNHGKTLPGSIGEHFPEHIGKKINPQFVEWMMGLPEDWTKID